jgi:hypothetical protein
LQRLLKKLKKTAFFFAFLSFISSQVQPNKVTGKVKLSKVSPKIFSKIFWASKKD